MDQNNFAVIMAGGIGSRFWPMSKPSLPKQFLDVLGIGETLIQMTFNRLAESCPKENIYVVTNIKYKPLIQEQLPELPEENILMEPMRKNTAPCIAYAAHKIYAINQDANIVVAPSDHLITETSRFTSIIQTARNQAQREDCLVTIGIKPSRPDTGYGYIQFNHDEELVSGSIKHVKKFTEKPNKELAELFMKSGDYYWNSGIFIWTAKSIINALYKFKPMVNQLFENVSYGSDNEQKQVNQAFEKSEDISIDFAVMENAKNVYVVLADFGWSDLGTWGSLYTHMDQDYNGNAITGDNTFLFDCKDSIVKMPNDKLVVLQGLKDYIVVESEGVLLVIKKDDEQKIKKYVAEVQKSAPNFFEE